MQILGLSGSLRAGSHNTMLLRAAATLLPPGAHLELVDGLADIPAFDEDQEHTPPEAVERLRDAIGEADAIVVATPEYNSSVPGHLKNALDWMSRPFDENPLRGKPAAVVGASTGMFGAVWAQAELRKILGATGARVLDEELPVANADEQFDDDGRLIELGLEAELARILGDLVHAVEERERLAA